MAALRRDGRHCGMLHACDSIGIELAEHFVVSRTGVTPIIEYVARLRKANLDEEDGIFRNTYPAMKNGGSAKKN